MKRILCLIDGLGSGGAERQMVGLAVLLKNKGYTVDLVCYHNDVFCVPIAQKGGVEPVVLKVNNSQWSKLLSVRRFIKERGGYDCVIAYKNGANAICCLLKMIGLKFKLIVSERNTDRAVGGKKKLFMLYRYADYVVPNSFSQGDFMSKHFPWMKKKIVVISNFTDTNHFTTKNTQKEGAIIVLTAARLARQKNIIRYLEAIALLKEKGVSNVHFDWYGHTQKGEEDYEEAVYAKVKKLGLEDTVTFHPSVTNIVDYYQSCDVFCLPSIYEGFPNVVCEAMSCGKPILCSRVCDNERLVRDGYNGLLFDPESAEDMADKMEKNINMNKEQRELWGKRSRELAIDILSEESFVNKYIALIES